MNFSKKMPANKERKALETRTGIPALALFALAALLAVTALVAMASPVSALVGPDVRVVSSKFDHDLTPGSQANLTIVLANKGLFPCAYKVTTQLQVSPPLSTEGLDTRMTDSFCAPAEVSFTFPIKADGNAVAGAYAIILATTYESEYRAAYATSNTVYARVNGFPEIVAHAVKTTPVIVYPGDDFSLDVAVDNVGSYRADSLTLDLKAETLEVRPSTETQAAATLQPRSSVTKTFFLHAPKNAEAKAYALSLTASYIDENGGWKTKSIGGLSVTLSKKAVIEASDGASPAFIDSRNNELRFNIKNTGTDSAKRLRAKLLPSYPFATQGSVQYVDELAPGQEKELVFYVDVDKDGVPGEYSLDLGLSFENDDGDKFVDSVPVSAKIEYMPLFNAVFLNYWYVWVLAAAAAAYLALRGKRAKKPKA